VDAFDEVENGAADGSHAESAANIIENTIRTRLSRSFRCSHISDLIIREEAF
jgi:hypothetical protein